MSKRAQNNFSFVDLEARVGDSDEDDSEDELEELEEDKEGQSMSA
jgi:hypothetical protein